MNKFLKEIDEQPAALLRTLDYYIREEGKEKLEEIQELWKKKQFNRVLFTGMGSSYFAPHTAACILSSYGIRSSVLNAGELLHYHPGTISPGTLLTAISQSGESYEVVKFLENMTGKTSCVGITNEDGSTLARKAGITLFSRAGKEEMTSTKTYVSTLMVLYIYSVALAGDWNNKHIAKLKNAAEAVENIINEKDTWLRPVIDFLGHPHFVQVIGRGPSYSSVKQGALMFMEAARKPAAGIYGGEFRHGPMEMVKEGFRAVIFAPEGQTFDQAFKMADDIVTFGGRVLLITNSSVHINNPGICSFRVQCENEFLFPVPAIIPLQFIVNQWATDEGNEPGNFTRGAKVTTTE